MENCLNLDSKDLGIYLDFGYDKLFSTIKLNKCAVFGQRVYFGV
jgi:hypothetical protein